MSLGELTKIYWWVIYASSVGQALFILTWVTMPFWRSWVGRALMVKSAGLGIVLWTQVYFHLREPEDMLTAYKIATAVLCVMAIGIWSQVIAIGHEVWVGRRERNRIKLQMRERCASE